MSKDEIDFLKSTFYKGVAYKENATWIKAFNLYNSSGLPVLKMTCTPCYFKVFYFCKTKFA